MRLLAYACVLVIVASGCGSRGGVSACNCPAGTFCDDTGACVAGDAPDLAVPDSGATGSCTPRCAAPNPHCNPSGRCVACLTDQHCPTGTYCRMISDALSACTPGCKDDARCGVGLACCNGACVSTAADARHCGGCGKACSAVHARPSCVGGKCQAGMCDAGWGDCNGNPADGCETNLHVDVNHCTACGKKCAIPNAIAACADACYATACNFGWDDCNQDLEKDGCETSVLADPVSCGACNKPCKALPNAAAACVNGACVLGACKMGFFNCDNDPANGCEADFQNDAKNCGGCGRVCPMNNPYCGNGVCQNGCLQGGRIPPQACAMGMDPFSKSPWVVCKASCQSIWISHAVQQGGEFHPEKICADLGYTMLSRWGGTCGNVCGYCEGGTSCMMNGRENFDNGGKGQDANGVLLRVTVMWECKR